MLAIRTIDSPAKSASAAEGAGKTAEGKGDEGFWRPPRGGMNRDVIRKMIKLVTENGGVAEEVLAGLAALETG